MIILHRIQEEYSIKVEDIKTIFVNIHPRLESMKSTDYILTIIKLESMYYSFLNQEKEQILMDQRFHMVCKVRIDDISSEIRIKYKDVYESYMIWSKNKYQSKADEWIKKEEQSTFDSEHRQEDENIYIGEVIFDDDNGDPEDNRTDGTSSKHKKQKDGDKIVLKFNNWEVRLWEEI